MRKITLISMAVAVMLLVGACQEQCLSEKRIPYGSPDSESMKPAKDLGPMTIPPTAKPVQGSGQMQKSSSSEAWDWVTELLEGTDKPSASANNTTAAPTAAVPDSSLKLTPMQPNPAATMTAAPDLSPQRDIVTP